METQQDGCIGPAGDYHGALGKKVESDIQATQNKILTGIKRCTLHYQIRSKDRR
jgi:hypothetical protein